MGQEKRILHEYQGTLRIIDRRLSLGKIFLDNKKESSVIQFPDTYEDGDRIFVQFPDDDPDCKPVSYYVQNEELCCGFLISMKDNGGGSIIVNWPRLKGIIFCGKWNTAKGYVPQVRDTVCFVIYKDMNGRTEALKISSAPPEKKYLASPPIIGRIQRQKGILWRAGIIKRIIKKTDQMGGAHSFGFIKPQEGEKDLYFPGDVFKRCYGKEAVEGDIVQFQCIKKGDKEMIYFRPENEEDSPWILVTRSNRDEKRVIRCPHKSFVNFQEPSEQALYLVYVKNYEDSSVCTRELKADNVPEAIAILRDHNIPEDFKLDSINYLIGLDLERPETCQASILQRQKLSIISRNADRLFAQGEIAKAFDAEIDRQVLAYDPERLKKFDSEPSFWESRAFSVTNARCSVDDLEGRWTAIQESQPRIAPKEADVYFDTSIRDSKKTPPADDTEPWFTGKWATVNKRIPDDDADPFFLKEWPAK